MTATTAELDSEAEKSTKIGKKCKNRKKVQKSEKSADIGKSTWRKEKRIKTEILIKKYKKDPLKFSKKNWPF